MLQHRGRQPATTGWTPRLLVSEHKKQISQAPTALVIVNLSPASIARAGILIHGMTPSTQICLVCDKSRENILDILFIISCCCCCTPLHATAVPT